MPPPLAAVNGVDMSRHGCGNSPARPLPFSRDSILNASRNRHTVLGGSGTAPRPAPLPRSRCVVAVVAVVFPVTVLESARRHLTVGVTCASPAITDAECLFTCFLAVCLVAPPEKCLFGFFAPF